MSYDQQNRETMKMFYT